MRFSFPKLTALLAVCFFLSASFQSNAQPTGGTWADSAKADALFYDGVRARIKEDDGEAERLFRELLALRPDAPAVHYELARLALKRRDAAKANALMQRAVALDTGNKWYAQQLAEVHLMREDYGAAGEEFARLATREMGRGDYRLKAAYAYNRGKKYAEALRQLQILEAEQPGDDEVLLQQQQLYLKLNDATGAARAVRRLIDRNPGAARYYTVLADLFDNNGQADSATAVYRSAAQQFPNDPIVQLALAQRARKEKDTAAYNAYIRKVITNRELDADQQIFALGTFLQDLSPGDTGRRDEIVGLAEELSRQHPADAAVLKLHGDVLASFGRRAEAAEQYKKSVAINPATFETWERLLAAYGTTPSDADSLILWSEKAIRVFPNQAVVHYFNGIGHSGRKAYPKAIAAFNRAADLQSDDDANNILADIFTALGDAYNSKGDFAESDSAFEKALRMEPRNATVLNNYAYYLSVRGARLAEAERMSKKSLDIRPGEATFLDTYGWILYKRGDYADARRYIQEAIDKSPEADATLYEHLGDVQFRLKNTDAAVNAWKEAKKRGGTSPQLDRKIADRKLYE